MCRKKEIIIKIHKEKVLAVLAHFDHLKPSRPPDLACTGGKLIIMKLSN